MYDQSNKEICFSSLRAPRRNAPKRPLPKMQLLASIVPHCCKEIEFVWKSAVLSAATAPQQPKVGRWGQPHSIPAPPHLCAVTPRCRGSSGWSWGWGCSSPNKPNGEKSKRGGKWTECCLCPSLWLLSRCCKFSLVICNLMIYS